MSDELSPPRPRLDSSQDPAIERGETALAIVRSFGTRLDALQTAVSDHGRKVEHLTTLVAGHIDRELELERKRADGRAEWTRFAALSGKAAAAALLAIALAVLARFGLTIPIAP